MLNESTIPNWLVILAWISLALSVVSFIYVSYDVRKHPQSMKVMTYVWPITTLFGSVLWVLAYQKWGRPQAKKHTTMSQVSLGSMKEISNDSMMKMTMTEGATNQSMPMDMSDMTPSPMPVSVFVGTCHCGAGCTLADLMIETLLFFFPSLYVIGGYHWLFQERLYAGFVWAFVLAYIIGVTFQYLAIVPMKHLGRKEGIKAAIKADTLSLTAWQVGMYATVAFCQLWLFPNWFGSSIEANTPVFWFMMQIAMLIGFCTAYPMNWFLIKKGIKERM
ncbi:hypothetical protein CBF34_02600 [Vagococcus penaei]|uniref:Uncharacterized protein n=1 Tax=Vagococcus penaei TaxID=633807 RepID=A0A1Q2D435_9ENTE|nr:DUF4396 domain-containing protein [Vagococcus penaei]AQP53119.1 hypothetical protein BW732_01990 [Vagococcus penaei]RSU06019.1 hypothetical protein CBF34_02600 [Vagococcus penaei]